MANEKKVANVKKNFYTVHMPLICDWLDGNHLAEIGISAAAHRNEQTQMALHHPRGEASDHLAEHYPKINPPLPLLSRQTMRAQQPRTL